MRDPDWDWIIFTPPTLARWQLLQCADLLERAALCPMHLIEAAKAAHLGLQAALTAALAGHGCTGALPEPLRAKFLAYFAEQPFDPEGGPPMYVMKFDALLEAAQKEGLTRGGGEPLVLGSTDRQLLSRLYQVRHSFEHPKPGVASYTPRYLLEAIRPAARVTAWLLRHNDVSDLLREPEHETVRAAAKTVERLCDQGLQIR